MENSYESFKGHIFELTKIDLNAYKERQMKRRIDALIAKNHILTYDEYVKAIKQDKHLFEEFVSYLTINVSEFYRNPEQWVTLEKEIIPYLINRCGRALKIWSAACSTGDEPYSLAMVLSKYMPLSQIKILATDIDSQVLNAAGMGLYREKSLKKLPAEFVSRYFNRVADTSFQISPSVKACVEFKKHNLLLDSYPKACDLIVCRNVLIYFTEDAKNMIYKKFYDSVKDGGILFVGSTEQIIRSVDLGFKPIKPFFYQKI